MDHSHDSGARVLGRRTAASGRWFHLVEIECEGGNGERHVWEGVVRATGSGVVAVFAVTREETVICIEQFRPAIVPIEQYRIARPLHALGLIAGLCDVQGEEASDAAVRELREEAGCVADQWVEVPMQAECAGVTDGIVRVWLALNARRVLQPRLDGSEVALGLRQIELPLAELPQALLQYHRETGNVVDPKLMACRGWYEHFTGRRF